jgi:trigger factor
LNITVTNQEKCKKQLQIEIPSDVVLAEIDRKAKTYARRITISGFRPGRAPVNLVKTRFHKELRDEVVSELIPTSFDNAIKEKSLKIVAEPKLDDMKFGEDDSINATFTIEVAPEFDLPDYKNLSLSKHVHETTDADVDKAIEMLREGKAELVPVEDRGAQNGDTVTVSLSGKADLEYQPEETASEETPLEAESGSGETAREAKSEVEAEVQSDGVETEAESGKAETTANQSEAESDTVEATTESDADGSEESKAEVEKLNELAEESIDITLGAEGNLQSFDEALLGAQAGEKKSVTIDYPKEYPDPNFAGRRWHFDLEVSTLRTKELPELDEEFLSGIDEAVKTVEELRARIRSNYEERNAKHVEDSLRNDALQKLIAANKFEVPEQMVEKQTQQRFSESINNLMRSGIDVRSLDLDWKAMADSQREKAVDDVRGFFILDRIVEAEKIEVSDEDLDEEIELMAQASNQTAAALKARLTKEGALDTIKEQIKHQKALDLIIDSADIKEVVGEEKKVEEESTDEGSQTEG